MKPTMAAPVDMRESERIKQVAASVRTYADELRAYRSRLQFYPQQHEHADGMVEAAEEIADWLESVRTS